MSHPPPLSRTAAIDGVSGQLFTRAVIRLSLAPSSTLSLSLSKLRRPRILPDPDGGRALGGPTTAHARNPGACVAVDGHARPGKAPPSTSLDCHPLAMAGPDRDGTRSTPKANWHWARSSRSDAGRPPSCSPPALFVGLGPPRRLHLPLPLFSRRKSAQVISYVAVLETAEAYHILNASSEHVPSPAALCTIHAQPPETDRVAPCTLPPISKTRGFKGPGHPAPWPGDLLLESIHTAHGPMLSSRSRGAAAPPPRAP
ncbi:hypothetical protein CDD83_2885 [Cordyceps sp. RAO-2017]|nr:hypothetical protein CDD83_2885 [Cordyceps sp. RAO-2017]